MVARNKTGKGYFKKRGNEPLAKTPIAVRLPQAQDAEIREALGSDLTNWVRKVIIQQWEVDKESLSDDTV